MRFEWDAHKNHINRCKHGIDFSDVPAVFSHPVFIRPDPRNCYGEERWIAIGWLTAAVAVVIYTEPAGDTIRIISARKATKQEVRLYAQAIENRFPAPGRDGGRRDRHHRDS
ncbi:BrnT family toxin [Pseudomonas sp. UBA4194]|uniref:BrnT family toxin n=1 Tax=Pseudomonas sp. UBA4194 TaxID=1947317 RepID=UPI0025CD85C9|nr:BrnT family toxin [Pseudomonas sp. UBA4194]